MLHRPKNIIYVSCFPESLVEDLSELLVDYDLTKAFVVDQFPQTHHYEALVLLQRKF